MPAPPSHVPTNPCNKNPKGSCRACAHRPRRLRRARLGAEHQPRQELSNEPGARRMRGRGAELGHSSLPALYWSELSLLLAHIFPASTSRVYVCLEYKLGKDKENSAKPTAGLSGPGHRKPLTTNQRPDMSATSSIRVPHLRRPASSRLHALFPAKCCTSETRRHRSSGYGVALSILACSAALTSCAETFQECHAALFPQDLPALVSRSNWACLHNCFGGSACSPCLVACVACSACLPPHRHFLF